MTYPNRIDVCINTRVLRERNALTKRLGLVGTFMDETAFRELAVKMKSGDEGVEGKHIHRRVKIEEQDAIEAARRAELERKGLTSPRPGVAETGERSFDKKGGEYVVIDGLVEQLETRYDLFGVRQEQKAARYTPGEAADARRLGIDAHAGEYMKTEKGGEVFLWKYRYICFEKGSVKIVQKDLMKRLAEYSCQMIHRRARGHYNGKNYHALELQLGAIPPKLDTVTRVLHDEYGFYLRTIPNTGHGLHDPLERRTSIGTSLNDLLQAKLATG